MLRNDGYRTLESNKKQKPNDKGTFKASQISVRSKEINTDQLYMKIAQ